MKIDRFVKSILKSVVYIMDETADRVDRVSDRASRLADNTRSVIYPSEGQTLRNIASFAAGIGLGVAAGMLLAPSSGAELRNSISDKVQNISDKVRGRAEAYATGTDIR
ncbi:MAG TPA: YtxH domain-containing protein [Blastocatellia bacterium]|nr:YtxH domain-containing protein [Blastocatellia bacterium]